MLRVANWGIVFKVYRGVPLSFAMTPLAARGCAVGKAGGCWTEIFSPPHPSGSPPSTRRKFLVVPLNVPRCPTGSPSLSRWKSPPRNSASPQDTEAFACRRGTLGSLGGRPMLPGAPACRKNPAGNHCISVENVPRRPRASWPPLATAVAPRGHPAAYAS